MLCRWLSCSYKIHSSLNAKWIRQDHFSSTPGAAALKDNWWWSRNQILASSWHKDEEERWWEEKERCTNFVSYIIVVDEVLSIHNFLWHILKFGWFFGNCIKRKDGCKFPLESIWYYWRADQAPFIIHRSATNALSPKIWMVIIFMEDVEFACFIDVD